MRHLPSKEDINEIKGVIDIGDYWCASDLLDEIIRNKVHIGTFVDGCQFLFAPNPKYYDETKESILKFLQQSGNGEWQLEDACGTPISSNTFFDVFVIRNMDKYCAKDYIKHKQMNKLNEYESKEHITEEGLCFSDTIDFKLIEEIDSKKDSSDSLPW